MSETSRINDRYRSWVEVDLDHFAKNWLEMRRLVGAGVKIMQVVKADAYGHGAMEISAVAMENGAYALGVANADEGIQLRISGIVAPILILSPSITSEIKDIIKYNLTPSVSDLSFAYELQNSAREADVRIPLHVEVDTGMGRGGTIYYEALEMIRQIRALPNIILEGLFTHLATSETKDGYNHTQWLNFKALLEELSACGMAIPIRHMAASGAMLNYPEFRLDMVRAGIISYGIFPSTEANEKVELFPVMTFKTKVLLVKEFPPGYSIGYGRSFVTARPTKIATIPVGYGDGYGFILSNQGEVLIGGKRVPIVGRISMDMSTVDVTDLKDCKIGDEVVLLGRQGDEYISAQEIAARVKTISYEILCALGKRAPRIFLKKGEVGAVEPQLRRIFIPDQEKSLARIDNIIRRCLHTRTKSVELGDAIYYEMLETMFGKEDRQLELRADFRYDITVSRPPEAETRKRPEELLDVTTHIEYRTVIKNHILMIGCAVNNEQLAAFFEDKQCHYRWLLNSKESLVPERDFLVQAVRVDGIDVPMIEDIRTDRGYEVWCGGEFLKEKLNRPVLVEIEIITKKARSSRNFSVYILYPTRGLEINFHYAGSDLANVRDVSFFAGRKPRPVVNREPGRAIQIKIPDDDWVFPHSGVTFVWDE